MDRANPREKEVHRTGPRRRTARAGRLLLLFALLLAPLLLIPAQGQAPAAAPDVTVDLTLSAHSLVPGGDVTLSVLTTINGIVVVSIPTQIKVTAPDGATVFLPLESAFDGSYIGHFSPILMGTHTVQALVTVGGKVTIKTAALEVEAPPLGFTLAAEDVTLDPGEPTVLKVRASANLTKAGMPLAKTLALSLRKDGENTSVPLCHANCTGACTFGCSYSLPAWHDLLDSYTLAASFQDSGFAYEEEARFTARVGTPPGLGLSLSHKSMFLTNESQVYTFNLTLDGAPLANATVDAVMTDPDGIAYAVPFAETAPGTYRGSFIGDLLGGYVLEAFVTASGIIARATTSAEVTDVADRIALTHADATVAFDPEEQQTYLVFTPAVNPYYDESTVDLSELYYNLTGVDATVYYGDVRNEAPIFDDLLLVPSGKAPDGRMLIEIPLNIPEPLAATTLERTGTSSAIGLALVGREPGVSYRIPIELPEEATLESVLSGSFSPVLPAAIYTERGRTAILIIDNTSDTYTVSYHIPRRLEIPFASLVRQDQAGSVTFIQPFLGNVTLDLLELVYLPLPEGGNASGQAPSALTADLTIQLGDDILTYPGATLTAGAVFPGPVGRPVTVGAGSAVTITLSGAGAGLASAADAAAAGLHLTLKTPDYLKIGTVSTLPAAAVQGEPLTILVNLSSPFGEKDILGAEVRVTGILDAENGSKADLELTLETNASGPAWQLMTTSFTVPEAAMPNTYPAAITARSTGGVTAGAQVPLQVHSAVPSLSITPSYWRETMRGTIVTYDHTITNNDPRLGDNIDLVITAEYATALVYGSDGGLLSDTNRNGMKDTGFIPALGSEGVSIELYYSESVPVGITDTINITAISAKDPSVRATVIDRVNISYFITKEQAYVDDLAVTAIAFDEDSPETVEVTVANRDDAEKHASLMLAMTDLTTTHAETLPMEIGPADETTVAFIIPEEAQERLSCPCIIEASLITPSGSEYLDAVPANNRRHHLSFSAWYHENLTRRIPISVREPLAVWHDLFVVRSFIDLDDIADPATIQILVPRYDSSAQGFCLEPAPYEFLTYDEQTRSGQLLFAIDALEAGYEATVYIYYNTPDTNVTYTYYPNRDFPTETTISNKEARLSGRWVSDKQVRGYHGTDYVHDLNIEKGRKTVRYVPGLPADGYEIYAWYPSDSAFATNVPLIVHALDGESAVLLNERTGGGMWQYIGAYDLGPGSFLEIQTQATNGLVVADAFRFRKVSWYSTPNEEERYSPAAAEATAPLNITVVDMTAPANATDIIANVTNMTRVAGLTPVQGPAVAGEPVTWTLTVPMEGAGVAVDLPKNLVSLSASRRTALGVEPLDPSAFTVHAGGTEADLTDYLLASAEADLARAEAADRASDRVRNKALKDRLEQMRDTLAATAPRSAVGLRQAIEDPTTTDVTIEAAGLPEGTESLEITYETEAPKIVVTDGRAKTKRITVSSETHYENITTRLSIAPAPESSIALYRTTEGVRERVAGLGYVDENSDGLVEAIEWVVPHLSNETYELSITILNPVEYLRDGDVWTVYFNTTGVGNLTITTNNSRWEEVGRDDNATVDEMRFLNVMCGEVYLQHQVLFVAEDGETRDYDEQSGDESFRFTRIVYPDFSCDRPNASVSNYMNIAGYATITLTFANQNMSVQDTAFDPVLSLHPEFTTLSTSYVNDRDIYEDFDVNATVQCAGSAGSCENVSAYLLLESEATGWYDFTSPYRRQYVATTQDSSTPTTDYQVLLNLTGSMVPSFFDWSGNCTDIRFSDEDSQDRLPHWTESCDADDEEARIWVQMDVSIDTDGDTFWMYYGNSSNTDLSNVSETFFEDYIYLQVSDCSYDGASGTGDCYYPSGNTDIDTIKSQVGNAPYYEFFGDGLVEKIHWMVNPFSTDEYYNLQFRWLFMPSATGSYTFLSNSDDASEYVMTVSDNYGPGMNATDEQGSYDIVAYWYGGHAPQGGGPPYSCVTGGTVGARTLTAGEPYWSVYWMNEWAGIDLALLCIDPPGATGYQEANVSYYPGQFYGRRYVSPEPAVGRGTQQVLGTFIGASGTPFTTLDETPQACAIDAGESCTVSWTLNATGQGYTEHNLRILVESNNTNVPDNATRDAIVRIIDNPLRWSPNSLDGSQDVSLGNLTLFANLSALLADHGNVTVWCAQGNCSQISHNFTNGTDIDEDDSVTVAFECENASAATYSALFIADSNESSGENAIDVTCTFTAATAGMSANYTSIYIYDTNGTATRADDTLVAEDAITGLVVNGSVYDFGDLGIALANGTTYLVEIVINPDTDLSLDADYHGETVIIADHRFGEADNYVGVPEYVITTGLVATDGGQDADIFVTAGPGANLSDDASVFEVGHIRGDPDIAYGLDGGGSTEGQIIINNGTSLLGTWSRTNVYDTGADTRATYIVDLDRDGDMDIIYGDDSDDIRGCRNDGGASFTCSWDLEDSGDSDIRSVTVGDFDNDGWLDIAYTNSAGEDVYVIRNDGTPWGDDWARTTVLNGDSDMNMIDAADIDRDGFLDLVFAVDDDWGGQTYDMDVYWAQNDQSPFDGGWTNVRVDDAGSDVLSVVAADFDGDGWIDVAATDNGDAVQVSENDGTPLGSDWTTDDIDNDIGNDAWNLDAGDIDGDGVPDLVAPRTADDDIYWYMMDSTPFGDPDPSQSTVGLSSEGDLYAVELADIDMDGDLDVIVGHLGDDIEIYENLGGGTFAAAFDAYADVGDDVFSVAVEDLDNDENSNILDFFTNASENLEEGVDGAEFSGYDNLSAGQNSTFAFIFSPDADWSGETSTLDLIIDDDYTGHNMKTYPQNFWVVRKPLRIRWSWTVGEEAGGGGYVEIDRGRIIPDTVNASLQDPPFPSTPVTILCHARDQDTLGDKHEAYGYNLSFYENGTLLGKAATNATGWAEYAYNTTLFGSARITCNATEDAANGDHVGEDGSEEFTLTIVDDIPPILLSISSNVANNSQLNRTQDWQFSFNVSDNYLVANGSAEHNGSGERANYTDGLNASRVSDTATFAFDLANISSFPHRGPIRVNSLSGVDSQGNLNHTPYDLRFDLYSFANVIVSADPGSVGEFNQTALAVCRVSDTFTGENVSGYAVNLTFNTTGFNGTYLTNASGMIGIVVNVTEPILVTCAIGNNLSRYLYANDTADTYIITQDPIIPLWSLWNLVYSDSSVVTDGAHVNRTTAVAATSYWTDNFQLDQAFVDHNGTGARANYTVIPFPTLEDANESWANRTLPFADSAEFPTVGLVNVTAMHALDLGDNANHTVPAHWFYLWSNVSPVLSIPNPNNPDPAWVTISCQVQDTETLEGVAGYTATIWSDVTGIITTGTTGPTGWLTTSYYDSTYGPENITCNISDVAGDYYYLGDDEVSEGLYLGLDAAAGAYNARVFVYDTFGDTDRSNDLLIFTESFLQLELDGTVQDVGLADEWEGVYNYSDYLVHVIVQPGDNLSIDADHQRETMLVADSRFSLVDTTGSPEYVVTTAIVTDDGARQDDVFVSVNGSQVNYTDDTEVGETGYVTGDLDIAVATGDQSPEARWRENNNTPTAGDWPLGSTITSSGTDANHIAAEDLDRSGTVDVLIANQDYDVHAVGNNGGGTSWTENDADTGATDEVLFVAWGDLDGDGDLDALAGMDDDGGDSLQVMENDGTPFSGEWAQNELDPIAGNDIQARGGAFIDLDGDGDLDVVACGGVYNSLIAYENDGTPFSGAWADTTIYTASICNRVAVGDFDNDGYYDVAITEGKSTSQITVLRNDMPYDGDAFDDAWTITRAVYGTGFLDLGHDIAVADIDDDGYLDIVALINDDETLSWFENDGTPFNGGWTRYTIESSTGNLEIEDTGEIEGSVGVGDIDADGDVDVVYNNWDGRDIYWYENDGTPMTGSWSKRTITTAEIDDIYSIYLADMDKDNSSNIIDFAYSSSENLEQGVDEFGGWDTWLEQNQYTFSFIMSPDDDWGIGENGTFTLLVSEENRTMPGRHDERLWGASYHPIRFRFTINVNRWRNISINESAVIPDPQNVSINPAFGDGTVELRCRVKDIDSGLAAKNVNVTFHNDKGALIGWDLSNTTGYANASADVDAIGVFNYSCNITADPSRLFSVVVGGEILNISMVDEMPPRWSSWTAQYANNSNLTRNQTLWVAATWQDNWDLNNTFLMHNGSGAYINYSQSIDGITATANYTLNMSNTTIFIKNGPLQVRAMFGIDNYSNTNRTRGDYFFNLLSYANITSLTKNDSDIVENDPVLFTCSLQDQINLTPIQDYNITFYDNVSGLLGWNTTNASGSASLLIDYPSKGSINFTCNITDDLDRYYFRGDVASKSIQFFVLGLSNLVIFDEGDPPISGWTPIFLQTGFYANYTNLTGQPITGAGTWCNITFNLTGGWTALASMTYNATSGLFEYNQSFNQTGPISWNVTCNASIYQSQARNETVNITKTVVNAMSPANGTLVDRDSVSAAVADTVTLTATVPEAPAGVNVTFYANLTGPSIAGQIGLYLGWNMTNATGQASLLWDPGADRYAGNHSWFGNGTYTSLPVADSNVSLTIIVLGGLNTTFNHSTLDPDAKYNKSQTVRVNATLASFGPENASVLNGSYLSSSNATLYPASGSPFAVLLPYDGRLWTGTYALPGTAPVGVWNATLNGTAEYFFNSSRGGRSFTVYGLMNVTAAAASPSTVYAYQWTNET
ncbi:DUF2341 domain-containing protein, partial [Candidatus Woesearchaeota archaeon]|nr:DUF2341 domain-containing protein [Candidatus Woesearchaeota archaeon]